MAIPSGSYKVSMESTAPSLMGPKPSSQSRPSLGDFIGSAFTTLSDVETWLTGSIVDDSVASNTMSLRGADRLKPFPPPPVKSKRREINQIITNTFSNINQERVLSFDTLVHLGGNLAKIYFTPAEFIWGKLRPSNIKENYLYVNGVYIKKGNYIIYEEDASLVVEVVQDLCYRLDPNWDIRLRIRASV